MATLAAHARRLRRGSQLLAGSQLTPVEVVDRAVALQGQDLRAVLRAIAMRSRPGTTVDDVKDAFSDGRLVRSWPLRGTLFATTPEHLAVLLSFTAPRNHQAMAKRRNDLGLHTDVLDHARGLLLEALAERPRTRAEVLELWSAHSIDTTEGRGYHLIVHLAIAGLVHWGPFVGEEQLLVATPQGDPVTGDPAPGELSKIVRSVIAARGPMTEADLAWWTKLPKGALRGALAEVLDLMTVDVEGTTALMIGEPGEDPGPSGVDLVPGFDEWILGYADRTLVADDAAFRAVVPGGNGIFRPAILLDGIVVGTWRVPIVRGAPREPEFELVKELSVRNRRAVTDALEAWPHS